MPRVNNRELARTHLPVMCPYPDCCVLQFTPCRTAKGLMRRLHAERLAYLSPEDRDAVFRALEHV